MAGWRDIFGLLLHWYNDGVPVPAPVVPTVFSSGGGGTGGTPPTRQRHNLIEPWMPRRKKPLFRDSRFDVYAQQIDDEDLIYLLMNAE